MSKALVLGLNPGFGGFNFHDPAVALVMGSELLYAAEEERFTRQKHHPGVFPHGAFRACLNASGVALRDIAEIAVGYSPNEWLRRVGLECVRAIDRDAMNPILSLARQGLDVRPSEGFQAIAAGLAGLSEVLQRAMFWHDDSHAAAAILAMLGGPEKIRVSFVEHHLAHAASAYYAGAADPSLVIVVDGVGEIDSATIWRVRNGAFENLRRVILPHSLGYFFAAVTAYLGFQAWCDEGKVMALAPYGEYDAHIDRQLDGVITLMADGFDTGVLVLNALGKGLSLDVVRACSLLADAFGAPPRGPSAPIGSLHRNVAWAAQRRLEQAVISFMRPAVADTEAQNLALAGGVFLNCKLNLSIREAFRPRRFFVQPVAGDAGLALGAALYRSSQHVASTGSSFAFALRHLAYGDGFGDDEIRLFLEDQGIPVVSPPNLADWIASALAEQRVCCIFEGRSEYGPRALGQRSILADPRSAAMRDRVNTIKGREPWRPFGGAILRSHAGEILEGFSDRDVPRFMVEAFRVAPAWQSRIPAVVHPADGTTRPQIVDDAASSLLARVLAAFFCDTAVPVLLNTSFNAKSEPLVNTPAEAYRCFVANSADILILGSFVITRSPIE